MNKNREETLLSISNKLEEYIINCNHCKSRVLIKKIEACCKHTDCYEIYCIWRCNCFNTDQQYKIIYKNLNDYIQKLEHRFKDIREMIITRCSPKEKIKMSNPKAPWA